MLTTLSPNADPFFPKMGEPMNEIEPGFIYNNGVPGLAVPKQEVSHVIRSISDEAIDEVFPPSAEEAAEIEAVEEFVEALADISELEEKEELDRMDISRCKVKRWEARRVDGLQGKPREARTMPDMSAMTHRKLHEEETSLVAFKHRPRTNQVFDARARVGATNKHSVINRHGKKVTRPIQQPRKGS